jgi:RNA polymerase sigma factor (sigma-70 family)
MKKNKSSMITHASTLPPSDPEGLREKNFGLSTEEFHTMVERLRAGDETLFEQIHLAQFDYCQRKLQQFEGLSEWEAYDATMETLLQVRDLLLQNKLRYGNLRFLFVRIAKQFHERGRKKSSVIRSLSDSEYALAEDLDHHYDAENFDQLERAFRQLGTACKVLLTAFYFKRQTLKEIALEECLSHESVRQQKSRCVKTLRKNCSLASF